MKWLTVLVLLMPGLLFAQTKVGPATVYNDGHGHTITVQASQVSGSVVIPLLGTTNNVITMSAWTGNQNDVSLDPAGSEYDVSSTGTILLTGVTIGSAISGREITIRNVGTHMINVQDENGGSSSANQFYLNDNSFILLMPKGSVTFTYSASLSKWALKCLNN